MNAPRVIAIDGPAASGKSTVARMVAERLGMVWVNSGALYRAITWWLVRGGGLPGDSEAAARLADVDFSCRVEDGGLVVSIDGENPAPFLRQADVNRSVSPVSQLPCVRDAVNTRLRALVRGYACVVEGRDIGTCVFPDIDAKFYVDASPEERARRRGAEGQDDRIAERDRMDSARAIAPLVAADDAVIIDSTTLTPEEVADRIIHACTGSASTSA